MDKQVREYSKAITTQFDQSLTHLLAAQVPFADLLDRMNEMGISYEAGDGATIARLIGEASAKVKEAAVLVAALQSGEVTQLRPLGADQ